MLGTDSSAWMGELLVIHMQSLTSSLESLKMVRNLPLETTEQTCPICAIDLGKLLVFQQSRRQVN